MRRNFGVLVRGSAILSMVLLISHVSTGRASAQVLGATIDPAAWLGSTGYGPMVSGTFTAVPGTLVSVYAVVRQSVNGRAVVFSGSRSYDATGTVQRWELRGASPDFRSDVNGGGPVTVSYGMRYSRVSTVPYYAFPVTIQGEVGPWWVVLPLHQVAIDPERLRLNAN
jgi:hypothetical protein